MTVVHYLFNLIVFRLSSVGNGRKGHRTGIRYGAAECGLCRPPRAARAYDAAQGPRATAFLEH